MNRVCLHFAILIPLAIVVSVPLFIWLSLLCGGAVEVGLMAAAGAVLGTVIGNLIGVLFGIIR